MKKNRFPSLNLETLDDRIVPTVDVSSTGGALNITGTPDGDILLQQSAPGTILVTDNGVTAGLVVGSFSSVNINLNARATTMATNLFVDLNDAPSFANLDIRLPNNAYNVNLQGGGNILPGNLTINTGSLVDDVRTNGEDLTIAGSLSVNLGAGVDGTNMRGDVLLLDTSAVVIQGNLTATNVNSVGIGANSSVGGFTNISTDIPGTFNNTVSLGTNGPATLNNVNITGSNADDAVAVVSGVVISGNLTVNLGGGVDAGENSLTVDTGATVSGTLTGLGGNNTNAFTVNGLVSGSLNLVGGYAATNTFTFGGTVLGSTVNITGGFGVDTVNLNADAFGPGAYLRVFLNAGNDIVNYAVTNPFAFRFGYFDGGFGNDTFNQTTPIGYPFFKRNF